jgi:RNA polymerase sigma factor (sigma-70 family)
MTSANNLTKEELNITDELYAELRHYAQILTNRINREDLADDLLQDSILKCLNRKDEVFKPIAYIKCTMYFECFYKNSTFTLLHRKKQRNNIEITDGIEVPELLNEDKIRQVIVSYHLSEMDYSERTLMTMRLNGYNNKEISQIMDIPYDTICRVISEVTEKLTQKVKTHEV